MSDEQTEPDEEETGRSRGPLIAAVVFLLVSIGVAVASFSGAFSSAPPVYPTNTPNPTQPRPTQPPTATPRPTATPIPADEARLVIELLPEDDVPPALSDALSALILAELEGTNLQAETGLRTMPTPTNEATLAVAITLVDEDTYGLTFVGILNNPSSIRLDELPAPWFVSTSGDFTLRLDGADDDLQVGAQFATIFLALVDGQIDEAAQAVNQLRPNILSQSGEFDSSVFTLLDYVTAQVEVAQGRPRDALVAYSQAIRRAPDAANILFNRGSTYLLLGDPTTAQQNYADVDRLPEGKIPLVYNQSLVALAQERFDEAAEQAEQLPDTAYAASLRGYIAYSSGDLDEALTFFARAADDLPESVPANLNLALTLIELGRNEEALTALDTLTELAPEEPQFLIYKGLALRQLGEPADAVEAFEAAADLDDTNPIPYVELAEIALAKEAYDEALELAGEALSRDGGAGRAYAVIGDAELAQENWRDARDAYREALDNGTQSPELYANLAWANHNNRSLVGAVENYEIAFAEGLEDPLMLYRYGFALFDLGQYEGALEAFEGAVNQGYDTADAIAMLALSLDANLRRDEAEETYQLAIDLDPNYADPDFLRELPLWSASGVTRAQTIINRLD